MKGALYILLPVFSFLAGSVHAQIDTSRKVPIVTDSASFRENPAFAKDTLRNDGKVDSISQHDPKKATFRSAVLPGWGQAYNKEYWKIPIVYAVLGVPAGFFIYNQTWYKRTKFAFDAAITNDTNRIPLIHPLLKKSPRTSDADYASGLRIYRNEFRRNKDYSILYFLAAWGLNVADATVFAHLKNFDVSDDLSFKIKPGYSPFANTSGISLVLAVKNSSEKNLKSSR